MQEIYTRMVTQFQDTNVNNMTIFNTMQVACFVELTDQFCCINAAKIDAAHTAWFAPKPFAWPWVWAMGVGGCCSRDEKITRVAVTLL